MLCKPRCCSGSNSHFDHTNDMNSFIYFITQPYALKAQHKSARGTALRLIHPMILAL